jgi:hypothetical protein
MKNLLIIILVFFLLSCEKESIQPTQTPQSNIQVQNNYALGEIALRNPDGTPLLWVNGKQVYRYVKSVTNLRGWSFVNASPTGISVSALISGSCMNQSNINRTTITNFALWSDSVMLHRYNLDGTDATDTFSAIIIIEYTKRDDTTIPN